MTKILNSYCDNYNVGYVISVLVIISMLTCYDLVLFYSLFIYPYFLFDHFEFAHPCDEK